MALAPEVAASIELALGALRRGGVVSFPTDTLYALGADALDDAAVARVFAIKARRLDNPLPLFVSSAEMASDLGALSREARLLVERFWPGALTIVVRKLPSFESLALSGGETVALRAPDHPIALDLLARLGRPITATSANLSGGPNPEDASEVTRQLNGAVDYVLDGGACPIGQASTIVDCSTAGGIKVLRQGAISEDEIRAVLGRQE